MIATMLAKPLASIGGVSSFEPRTVLFVQFVRSPNSWRLVMMHCIFGGFGMYGVAHVHALWGCSVPIVLIVTRLAKTFAQLGKSIQGSALATSHRA